nr:MAG TPA: hypothetical protein [Caudoviricetes sp.]
MASRFQAATKVQFRVKHMVGNEGGKNGKCFFTIDY